MKPARPRAGIHRPLQLAAALLCAAGVLAGAGGVAVAQRPAPPPAAGTEASLDRGAALLSQAGRAIAAGDSRNAAVYAQQALALYRGLADGDPRAVFGRANAHYYLGVAASMEGRDPSALEHFQAALQHYNVLSGVAAEENRLLVLEAMTPVLLRAQRVDDAIKVLRAIAAEQTRLGKSRCEQARSRDNLGILLMRRGQTLEALRELQQAVALSAEGGDSAGLKSKYLYDLGLVESRLERHDAAIEHYRQALALAASVAGSQAQQAEILLDYAVALTDTGRADEARQQLQRALDLVKGRPELTPMRAKLLANLANNIYRRPGQQESGLRLYREVVALTSNDPSVREVQLVARMNIANHMAETGQVDEAIRIYRESLRDLDATIPTGQVRGLHRNLGLMLARRGLRGEAQEQLLAALKLDWQSLAANLPAMTRVQKHLEIESSVTLADPILALAFAAPGADAAQAYEAVLLTKALHTESSRAERLGLRPSADPAIAAKHERYLELRRQVSRRTLEAKQAKSTPGGSAQAADLQRLAKQLQDLELELKNSPGVFVPDARLVAVRPTDVLAKLQPGERLLEYVIYKGIDFQSGGKLTAARYGVFVLDGATRRVTAVDLGDAKTINEHVAKYRDIQQTQANPANPRLDEGDLARYARTVRRLVLDPVLPRPQESRRVYVAPDDLLGLVPFEALPLEQASARPRYLVEQLEVLYLATGRDLTRFGARSAQPASRELWLVGDPAFDATAAQRLASTADSPAPARAAPAPLAGRSRLSLVGGRVRTMGGSSGAPPADWDRLEGTRTFVLAAAEQARKAGLAPRVLLDAAASEERVAGMRSPRIAMFATHGYFMQDTPTVYLSFHAEGGRPGTINPDFFETADPLHRSMLVLAGANRRSERQSWYALGDTRRTEAEARQRGLSGAELELRQREVGDGLLTAYEVMGLDLSGTELVVLTACETGLGIAPGGSEAPGMRQTRGESVAGLRQAFGVAGARAVVMSMWSVPLDETIEQMQAFLDSWLSHGNSRYAAFRESQLKALASARQRSGTGHPFWWAGFVYVGDPGDQH